jgi:integrase/recombinase XerD
VSRRGILTTKPKATAVCLPLEMWPEADQTLWARARSDEEFLDDGGLGRNWAHSTATKYIRDYGRWLAWLRRIEPEVLNAEPLSRLTRERIRSYVKYLQSTNLAQYSVSCLLRGIGSVAWAFSETDHYYWIVRFSERLAYRAIPVRNKRQIVRPTYDLVCLGQKLMTHASSQPVRYSSAVEFRNGLIVALLAYRPIRRGNISIIVLDRHLAKVDGGYHLQFGEHETKQRKPLDVPVPDNLTVPLEVYLNTYRPVLMARPPFAGTAGDALWVANDGGPLSHWGLYAAVCNVTRKEFGHSLNPHIFRDSAVTTVALDDPSQIAIVADILGHSNMVTSAKHYNQARCIDASRRFQAELALMRKSVGRARP